MFPQFNIHSTPLLILVIQGLLFAALLLIRYFNEHKVTDLLMALILLVMAYHRFQYTIGFMGWYDTFKNSKVNYILFSLALSLGPLIYLYVRSILVAPFKVTKRDLIHFLPISIFLIYRIIVYLYDSAQPNWEVGYEGELHREIHVQYVNPILQLIEYNSFILYYAFTINLFSQYRRQINQYFSNTYKVELGWIKLFLVVYGLLLVYRVITDLVDAFIVELHYVNFWWTHLFSSIAVVFLGVKSYFTNLSQIQALTIDLPKAPSEQTKSPANEKLKSKISTYMDEAKAFLKPEFTIRDLAMELNSSIHEISETINNGFGMNFNEYINQFRVEEVKKRLVDPSNDHFSLVAIAYDSGFNSKATFNRIFKQKTGLSPSEFKSRNQ